MESSDKINLVSEEPCQINKNWRKSQKSSSEIEIKDQGQQQSWRQKKRLKTFGIQKSFHKLFKESLKVDVQTTSESITTTTNKTFCAEEQLLTLYTKIKQIGMGFQSICYKVEHKCTHAFYVAKIARCAVYDEEFLLSLKQEYTLLKQLDHPNIIQIYESFESENEFIQIIEFVNAQSLDNKIFTRKFKGSFYYQFYNYFNLEQEIVQIGYKLLKTLEYLHNKGIMHRDINLSNVLYSKKSNIFKLLDFGVAKQQLSSVLFNLSSAGNTKYHAPEMFSCKSYSFKIDVWGVGLILYSLLHSNDIGTKSLMKTKCQLTFLDNSEPFQELLIQLLQKDQEKRVSAKEALELKIFQKQF